MTTKNCTKNKTKPSISPLYKFIVISNIALQVIFPVMVSAAPVVARPIMEEGDATTKVRSYVVGQASSKVNEEINSWLNQFGTSRARLGVDEKFSIRDYSLELLVPFWENKEGRDHIIFSQVSAHRMDSRTQGNFGLGYRHFDASNYMLGLNAFLDHDFSYSHSRWSVGGEFWHNYLKLGTNAYMRMNSWKDSHQVEDYEERPSNGWDIRVDGYLPSWPQLGAKLAFEQYYGDEVGLFGSNRQKDPHALTAGLNYTPFSLLTVSAEHKRGKSSQHETLLGLNLTYRLGESLQKQLDSSRVHSIRTLQGSRYDLVERNNNIVFEYRKKETIFLDLPASLEGFANARVPLTASVNTKHPLKNIRWDASSLIAAGGKIEENANVLDIILPNWVAGSTNTYTVSAIACDVKENCSHTAQSLIIVKAEPTQIDPNNSAFKVEVPLDGLTINQPGKIIFIAKNALGHPLKDLQNLTFILTGLDAAQVSDFKNNQDGTYTATLSSPVAGAVTVQPQIDGKDIEGILGQLVNIIEGNGGGGVTPEINGTLAINKTEMTVDDETNFVTLSLLDKNAEPVVGKQIIFDLGGAEGAQVINIKEEKPGVYQGRLTSTKPGRVTITPKLGNEAVSGAIPVEVTVLPGNVISGTIDTELNMTVGDTDHVVTFWAYDQYSNPVSGKEVKLEFEQQEGAEDASLTEVTDKDDGSYTAFLNSTKIGQVTISAKVDKKDLQVEGNRNVQIDAGALSTEKSELSVAAGAEDNGSATLNMAAGDPYKVIFSAKDDHENPLTELSVTFKAFKRNDDGSDGELVTNAQMPLRANNSYSSDPLNDLVISGEYNVYVYNEDKKVENLNAQITVEAGGASVNETVKALTVTMFHLEGLVDSGSAALAKPWMKFGLRDQYGNAIKTHTEQDAALFNTCKIALKASGNASGVNGDNEDPIEGRFLIEGTSSEELKSTSDASRQMLTLKLAEADHSLFEVKVADYPEANIMYFSSDGDAEFSFTCGSHNKTVKKPISGGSLW